MQTEMGKNERRYGRMIAVDFPCQGGKDHGIRRLSPATVAALMIPALRNHGSRSSRSRLHLGDLIQEVYRTTCLIPIPPTQ